MPKVDDTPQLDAIRHEYFCLPIEGADAPRLEGFPSNVDDPETGRSHVVSFCTRCMECGATSYRPLTD